MFPGRLCLPGKGQLFPGRGASSGGREKRGQSPFDEIAYRIRLRQTDGKKRGASEMEVWRPCAMSSVALHGALPRRPRPDRSGAGRSGPERTAVAARTDGMV